MEGYVMSEAAADVPARIAEARRVLAQANNILIVTGAGISAESGVPTFRGTGERWRDKHFSELADPEAFARDPREIWDWYLYRRTVVAGCVPNSAHRTLAKWARRRTGVTLVTQNVDGLHDRAGHPSHVRLHGSLWRNRCTACGTEREETSQAYESLPQSLCCSKLERPAIVWFGETIPSAAIRESIAAAISADAVLAIGTSGTVHPAASFVKLAKGAGTVVIDVNPEPSQLESDISILMKAGEAIPLLVS